MATIRPGQRGCGDVVLIGPRAGVVDINDASPFVERQGTDGLRIDISGIGAELEHAATQGDAGFITQPVSAHRNRLVGCVIATEEDRGVGNLEARKPAQAGGVDDLGASAAQQHLAGEILIAGEIPVLERISGLATRHVDGVTDSSGEVDVAGSQGQRRRLRGGIGDVATVIGGVEIIDRRDGGLRLQVVEVLSRAVKVDCSAQEDK